MLRQDELALFESAQGALVAVGDDGTIEYASQPALDLVGWGPDLVGRPLVSIIPQRLQARHHAGFSAYVRTGRSNLQGKTVRVPARRPDGSEVELDLTIRVFRRPDGSKLVSAGLSLPALGRPPAPLIVIEGALARRMYQLI